MYITEDLYYTPLLSGNSSNNSSNTSSSNSVCSDSAPSNTSLKSVARISATSVKLTWDKNSSATSYAISYGTSSGNYSYGATTGDTEITINSLNPSLKYYFVVTPINNCKSGNKSGELSISKISESNTVVTNTNVLGTSSASISQEASQSATQTNNTSKTSVTPSTNWFSILVSHIFNFFRSLFKRS